MHLPALHTAPLPQTGELPQHAWPTPPQTSHFSEMHARPLTHAGALVQQAWLA
jgi:hypothetical protein